MKKLHPLSILLAVVLTMSFVVADKYTHASFPGGVTGLDNYLRDSLCYPAAALNIGKEEIVRVSYKVSEKGVAHSPVMSSLFGGSAEINAEVERLIGAMPVWTPATDKRGNPVSSSHYSIVRFVLPDSLADKFPLAPDKSLYENFDSTEIMPAFQGGEDSFQNYLRWTIRYPQKEKDEGRDGTVYVYFEIATNGTVGNVKCQQGVVGAPGLAQEAIRVVSEMPRWTPGYSKGKPVKVGMTVPVRFMLN